MPQALRAIRARVFGRCSASTLGRHAALVALALVLVLTAEAGASAGSRPKSHTVKTLSSETSVDPTVDCGAPAADPVPDGQDIVVTIGLGPSFTVGQIPSDWWQHPPYGDGVW
ncbi:MAG TPA: hypothetical protein VJ818_05585, partial [Actinomycetota bacterium]|nr:hypothetical protein [Actinomycetota bacterium]